MKRIERLFVGALFVAVLVGSSTGQGLAFDLVAPPAPPGEPQVVHGTVPATPEDYPATFVFKVETGCTSTAIGQRVILTAAHCLAADETGTLTVGTEHFSVQCMAHPAYGNPNLLPDYALCFTDTDLVGIDFETISTSLAHPRVNESVTLLGYGCVEPGGVDHDFGSLRFGRTTVVAAVTPSDSTILTRGQAALCFGDSGGAAYHDLNSSGSRRVVVGVNSLSDMRTNSQIAATATFQFLNWAIAWSAEHGVAICGLDSAATNCR